jgi:type IV secretory pathway component VirB8
LRYNLGMPLQSVFSEKDYYVEIWNDEDTHFIRVASFDNFDDAGVEFRRLTVDTPDMRVVMRRRAQVYEHYIPQRLRRGTDRRG